MVRAPSRRRSTPRLPFARGTFTVIFDAEDRPEPNQLRRALDVFRAKAPTLPACKPRSPSTTPTTTGCRALFTAEYAAQFDLFLPGLVGAAAAASARRLVQPFPHRRPARGRRLGSLQRDRRRRPRHAAGALRLSLGDDRSRRPTKRRRRDRPVAAPAHALVQRLDAPCQ